MKINDFNVNVALPPQYSDTARRFPAVYLMGETDVEPLMKLLAPHFDSECMPFILAGIEGKDWNTPFSPWPAPKLGKNLGPFSGGGPQFLLLLEQHIAPAIDNAYRTVPSPENRAVAGYSLAGLLALYALYNSRHFSNCACVSGSLWFPQWVEYARTHAPAVPAPRMYISLGDKENESRNSVMATVADCTQRTIEALAAYTPFFELNAGGHFKDVQRRIVKGLLYVMKPEVDTY